MAGKLQLSTVGSQDIFFTENPEYTYFIKNFKKHPNFARFTKEHDVQGEVEFGHTLTCTLPADSGDLLKTVRLHVVLKGLGTTRGWVESIGHAMIDSVELVAGGTIIQRIPKDWLQIYSEHYVTQTKQTNLSKLIGKPPYEFSGTPVQSSILTYLPAETKDRTLIIDVPFYFHNNPELAIPICAITQEEVEINVKLASLDKCTYDVSTGFVSPYSQTELIKSFRVQTEFVMLDNIEKVKIQETPTDFIITQIQMETSQIPANTVEHSHKLEFVNPVKELYFIIQRKGVNVSHFDYDDTNRTDGNIYNNYEHLKNLRLRLDSDDILDELTGNAIHMRAVQSGIHHSRTQLFRRFYSYSFALEPERWFPTGQRNFSLVKEQHVNMSLNNQLSGERELKVLALSYNILRIENGATRLLFQSGRISD